MGTVFVKQHKHGSVIVSGKFGGRYVKLCGYCGFDTTTPDKFTTIMCDGTADNFWRNWLSLGNASTYAEKMGHILVLHDDAAYTCDKCGLSMYHSKILEKCTGKSCSNKYAEHDVHIN